MSDIDDSVTILVTRNGMDQAGRACSSTSWSRSSPWAEAGDMRQIQAAQWEAGKVIAI